MPSLSSLLYRKSVRVRVRLFFVSPQPPSVSHCQAQPASPACEWQARSCHLHSCVFKTVLLIRGSITFVTSRDYSAPGCIDYPIHHGHRFWKISSLYPVRFLCECSIPARNDRRILTNRKRASLSSTSSLPHHCLPTPHLSPKQQANFPGMTQRSQLHPVPRSQPRIPMRSLRPSRNPKIRKPVPLRYQASLR